MDSKKPTSTIISGRSGYKGFRSQDESEWFEQYFAAGKAVLIERAVDFSAFPTFVTNILHRHRWEAYLTEHGTINENLVRLFYGTLVAKSTTVLEAYVRGTRVPLSLESLAHDFMFGAATPASSTYPCDDSTKFFPRSTLIKTLAPGAAWHSSCFPVTIMPDNHRLLNLINVNCIIPTNTKGVVRQRQAVLLYLMLQPSDVPTINLPKHFFEVMKTTAHSEDPHISLPYGYLVSHICHHFGVAKRDDDKKTPITFLNQTSIKKSFKEVAGDRPVKQARGKAAATEAADEEHDEEDVDRMVDEGYAAAAAASGGAYDMSSLGRRMDEFDERLTSFQSDYQRDMSMMMRMQADAWRLQFGEDTVPSYYHNPYPPHDASGPSGP